MENVPGYVDYLSKYNKKSVSDRDLDQLMGMAEMGLSDDKIVQHEAEALHNFLVRASNNPHPVLNPILNRVSEMLSDNYLDAEEAEELKEILKKLTGNDDTLGEMGKSSTLPLCEPPPDVSFKDKVFVHTGTFAYGNRKEVEAAVTELGGTCKSSVSKKVDFVVLGIYVTDSWIHEKLGRKIEKAMEIRSQINHPQIIHEPHWEAMLIKARNL
jgi:NAD-dependent DNA ligase